jgi:hypothetical protein
MTQFTPASIELTGALTVALPVDEAFEMFSPEGEKLWVPGWAPEVLYPAGDEWTQGQIFRTQEERGAGVWVISALDRASHAVEYFRIESNRYVARVRVRCVAAGASRTRAEVSYLFVGLTPEGNHDIGEMTVEAYGEKMERWQRLIEEYLDGR